MLDFFSFFLFHSLIHYTVLHFVLLFTLIHIYICLHVNLLCFFVAEHYQPMFTSYSGEYNMPVKYKFVIGQPACGSMQTWPIYHNQGVSIKHNTNKYILPFIG